MGFANLQSLESRLSTLQSNLSTYNSQLGVQKRRMDDLESIIRDIQNICDGQSDNVNSCFSKLISNYEQAVKGIPTMYNLTETTILDKEKDCSNDENIGNALTQLRLEINDVNNKINELESNIRNANSDISSCQNAIEYEKKSIASEYRDKYNRAQAKVDSTRAAYDADPASASLKREYDNACRDRDVAKNEYNNYKSWL